MKILFITNKLPFPKNDGRKNILMQYIETIKNIDNGIEIMNASFIDDEAFIKQKPNEISKIIRLDQPKLLEKLFNLIWYTILLRKWPLQVSMYYSRKTHRKIMDIMKGNDFTHVVYDMVRVAPYIPKETDAELVMNYDDLLSLRYERQLEYINYIPSILGGVASYFPGFVNRVIGSKWLQKKILKFESKLLKKYEKEVAQQFNHLVFTSPKESNDFASVVKHKSSVGIPMAYNIENTIASRGNIMFNKVLFIGKMDIPHNVAAVLYFCEKIWPLVKKADNNLEFHIIGKNPIRAVRELEEKFEGVKVIGPVEDITLVMKQYSVFVAPLVFGTGIKTKVIEALANGVPVVSTHIGAEGINFKNGYNMYVSDNEEQFAEYILELTHSENRNDEFSIKGKELVEQEFSTVSMTDKWKNILTQNKK
ncbi:glycosyltransferase [Bacillus cereus]|uniref:glycosyltransferase n=1 Tax=Bacillus cereus group TaxID=86661 RepID=UPI00077ABA1A|nr:glycosyltransferase family 4 protein [Bacillus cereus]KXY68113.1 hypothetical protein AT275_08470 [Bacillus cereus]